MRRIRNITFAYRFARFYGVRRGAALLWAVLGGNLGIGSKNLGRVWK